MSRLISSAFILALTKAYDQSLTDCEAFAATFDNTCTGGWGDVSSDDVLSQTGDEITTLTCTGGKSWCVGEEMSSDNPPVDTCTHDVFLCVTCKENSNG